MTTIKITAPAGSGNTFATHLFQKALKCDVDVNSPHDPEELEKAGNKVFILRNPYDCIASAAERHLDTVNDKYMSEVTCSIDDTDSLDKYIEIYCNKYHWFLQKYKDAEDLLLCSFEFVTLNPVGFAEKVANHFNIELDRSKLDDTVEDVIFDELKKANLPNRAPREKNESRKIIEHMIQHNAQVADLHKQYIEIIKILQSTEI
jgi:hypothetical protein